MVDAWSEHGLGRENLIPSSESRRRLTSSSKTETLTKLTKTSTNKALPLAKAGIHRTSKTLRPQRTRKIGGDTGGRHKKLDGVKVEEQT